MPEFKDSPDSEQNRDGREKASNTNNGQEIKGYFQQFRDAALELQGLALRYRDPHEIPSAESQDFQEHLVVTCAYDPRIAVSDNGRYVAIVTEDTLGFVNLSNDSPSASKMFTVHAKDVHNGIRGFAQACFAKTWNGLFVTTAAAQSKVYRMAWSEPLQGPPQMIGDTPAGHLNALQAFSPGGDRIAYCHFDQGRETSVMICPTNIDYIWAPAAFKILGSLQALQFNEQGNRLAVGGDRGHLQVYTITSARSVATMSSKLNHGVTALAFGCDDTVYAGTAMGQVVALRAGETAYSPMEVFNKQVTEESITAICRAGHSGGVLVGTAQGKVLHIDHQGSIKTLVRIPYENINSLATDATGDTLVIGLYLGGALVLKRNSESAQ